MKITLLILSLLAALSAEAQTNTNGCVLLAWNASPSETGDTNTEFYVLHHSTNAAVALANWDAIASVPAGTNAGQIFIPVGVHFFYLTFSNQWGESGPSNIVGSPQAPLPPSNLRIMRLHMTP